MMSKYKQKAIPLISVDASGKYVLTAEASEFIRNVPGPIGVVSVAGLYRTGKSYLLNQMLLNRSNGFGVGPTINPCTKGLWCWGTPIKGETPEGEKLNIIVIDTQGIGALDEDQTHDTRIFTLAILASSCFIYNSVGSIDQNAVQNLSLVVNLTKHIQLRTDKSADDEDPDKIANYFPSFFWVVRDFSLQIQDSEGNKMTSKEYLEKALALQKGYSEDTEEKNKIRKMLTSFFKQRQCFTLVRPLIQESKLQDLDKMNFDDLRPEFVSQVINFRKRVVGRMKPKMLNGQRLSGELYLSMLSSYVASINDGAVPNIENAWHYMCQEQCTKVMSEAMQAFDSEIRDIKIPCSADDMNKCIEAAEEAATQKFKKRSIGDEAEKYYKDLQTRMKQKAKQLRKINAEQGKNALKKYIAPFATTIQQKLSKDQFSQLEQFTEELKKLEDKLSKEGPNYVDAGLYTQICLNKILSQGVTFMVKKMKNQKQQIKKTLEEKVKINENQIDGLRKQKDSQQSALKQRLSQLDKQKIQMTFKLQKMQIELERATREKLSEGEQLSRNLNAKKSEIEQIKRQLQQKNADAYSKMQQMNQTLQQETSNWEKQKAIFQLKIKQLAQKNEDLEKKLSTTNSKLVLETNQLTQKLRDQSIKLQDQIGELQKNLSEANNKNERLEQKESEIRQKFALLTEKYETTERKLKDQSNLKQRELQKIKNEHQNELTRVKNQMKQTSDEGEKMGRELEDKCKRLEMRTKELTEELRTIKSKSEKESYVLSQQILFAKQDADDAKNKLTETKSHYENKIAAIEADKGMQMEGQYKTKIDELKLTHEEELRTLQRQFKQTQRTLTFQLQTLTKDRNELELKLKVCAEQLSNERTESGDQIRNLTENCKQLDNELKALQKAKTSELSAREGVLNEKILLLEQELKDAKEEGRTGIQQAAAKAEQQITSIKNICAIQKMESVGKYNEEKEKAKKKLSATVEQYERRLQQDYDNHQQELERIESEYQNQLRALNTTNTGLTHEKQMLAREKLSLEQRLFSLNQRYNKMENDLTDRLQKLHESSKSEKDSLTKKIQDLQQNKNDMEKLQLSLKHEREQLQSQVNKNIEQIDELKTSNKNLSEKYEFTKNNLQERIKELQEKYLREKSRFDTQNALLHQKRDFSEQKIAEIQKELKIIKDREQDQLKLMRERFEEELLTINTKAASEKRNFEEKVQKLKKQNSENETNLIKQLSDISKAKAVDEQKIEYLDKKLAEVESKSTSEILTLTEQAKVLRQKLSAQTYQLKARIEELQMLADAKDEQVTTTKNKYEITIALNESKIKNLQDWGEKAIAEKTDMIKNLQRQLDDSRRRSENDKSSQQQNHQDHFTKMESKYRGEINQLNQDVNRVRQQLEHQAKDSQKAIKDLTEKLAIEKQSRAALEFKVTRMENEFSQKELKLTAETDRLRAEKDSLSFQMQKAITKQKQVAKQKISEIERKVGEAERLKQQAVFDREKQEAKWNVEKTSLQEQIDEFKDLYDKQKSDSKRLMRQNERLRMQRKKNASYIKNTTGLLSRETTSEENKQNSQVQ